VLRGVVGLEIGIRDSPSAAAVRCWT